MSARVRSRTRTSLGNKGRTEAGDVQVMSAGSGIRHSEYNLEPTQTKIFQIWIEPTNARRPADLGSEAVSEGGPLGKTRHHRVSGFADDADALPIRADARVLATTLKAGESAEYAASKARNLYLVPAAGSVEVNGVRVNARDGAAISRRSEAEDHRAGRFRAGAGRRGVSDRAIVTPKIMHARA